MTSAATRNRIAAVGADPTRVLPTTSDAFPTPAVRPAYSVLSPRAWVSAGLTPLRSWQDSLAAALADRGLTKGDRLAQGLVEYAAEECRAIMGMRQDTQAEMLGYAPRAAVIHRDHMVQL